MLGLFKAFEKKVDHPMATAEEAKAILEPLSAEPPVKALDELEHWLSTVRETDGFPCDDRLAVVKEIDDASRAPASAVLADYFAHVRQRDQLQRKMFDRLHAFWSSLAGAYERCISDFDQAEKHAARVREEMPLVFARSFRASSCVARMLHLRYQELNMDFWVGLARQFATAEKRRFDEVAVVPYPREIHATARSELLKILGLYLAAPHELSMEHVELAYRIIDRFAASFSWSLEPTDECNFMIDLAVHARPRQRDPKDQPADSRRFFGGGPALQKLEEIERLCNANILSEETRFGAGFTPEYIVTVIRHIRTYLGASPPRRKFPRLALSAPVSIIHGFRPICQRVASIEVGSGVAVHDDLNVEAGKEAALKLAAEEIESAPESWQVKDRSEWGVGAEIPPALGQWAEPGVLCGIQEREGASWWVGIIRRLSTEQAGRTSCGFWVLSKKPMSVWLRVLGSEGHKADNWETSTGSFSYTYLRAIILPDALRSQEKPIIILEPKGFVPGNLCELMVGEHARTIQMLDLLEGGADYVRATFNWYKPQKK